ncbi:MAG TPA: hypothetical protein VFA10_02975 [Ktedonobacteraceae bacterium]|nr:hypothetical protein [Ktedonobacteraceae bacterium]
MRSLLSRYVLLLGLVGYLVSACASPATSSSRIKITPKSTEPQTLAVTVQINEDQNASDGKSDITVQFSTTEIADPNYVNFVGGERISCNGTSIPLGASASYTLRVPASSGYVCSYQWHGQFYQLANVHARTRLLPVLQPVSKVSQYVVTYNPDQSTLRCLMRVIASDGLRTVGSSDATPVPEDGSGTYIGPNVSSLNGQGTLLMTRICHFSPSDVGNTQFNSVDITYTSIATVNVTWVS